MNPAFEFVIAILIIVFTYKLVTLRMHQKSLQSQRGTDDADRLAWQQRLDELEERVKVLERIVTDDKYDLKRQIEALDR
jgi:ABC-type transport system involved in Fe-S cluster assembly fused permease/ATPase subunit